MATYAYRSISERQKIQSLWEGGASVKEIAQDFDLSVSAIYTELKRGEPESNNCIRFRFCAFFLENRIKSKPLDTSRGFDDTTLKNFTTIFAIYS